MYIEDEELRTLYQVASADHLQTIETGLLTLERQPHDQLKLDELLRATHSLKGDSRMLGVKDAETLTHHLEDILSAVKQGKAALSSHVFENLYQGLDAIKQIAHEAITGEPSQVSVFHIVAQLVATKESTPAVSDLSPSPSDSEFEALLAATDSEPIPIQSEAILNNLDQDQADLQELLALAAETSQPAVDPQVDNLEELLALAAQAAAPQEPLLVPEVVKVEDTSEAYRIDTVRIQALKLDTLMDQTGELTVTKQRIARQLDRIRAISTVWEESSREAAQGFKYLLSDNQLQMMKRYRHLEEQLEHMGDLLSQLERTCQEDLSQLDSIADTIETGVRELQLLPLSTIFNLFPRSVRDIAKQQDKDIDFVINGGDTVVDRRMLEAIKDPLTHLLRNAIDHGIETPDERVRKGKHSLATLTLKGYRQHGDIVIEVIDDGRGLDLEIIKTTAIKRGIHTAVELAMMTAAQIQSLIFVPGFSTRTQVTDISGRGVGLDVVRSNVEKLQGDLHVESTPDQGCVFRMTLRSARATFPVMVVLVGDQKYGLPTDMVEMTQLIALDQILTVEGKSTLLWRDQPIELISLADVLGGQSRSDLRKRPCILLRDSDRYLGVLVDGITEYTEIQLKPQSKLLKRVKYLLGATILSSGELCHVLNPADLMQPETSLTPVRILEQTPTPYSVLLVEDSIPIRTQMRRILEGAGYEVTTAVDGMDGFQKLRVGTFNAIVSDVEMPNLTGIEMTERIRRLDDYRRLPIILVTTLASDSDRQRGLEAGANAYLTKGDFEQSLLLDTLRGLLT